MHNYHSKFINRINVLLEFVLILASYWVASIIRALIPIGTHFTIKDSINFMPLSIVYATTMVIVFWSQRKYRTLTIRSRLKEIIDIGLAVLVALLICSAIIYLFRLEQFSRLLMIYCAVLTEVFILTKRIILNKIERAYIEKHQIKTEVLLIGSGLNAIKVYNTILKNHERRMYMKGYLGSKENEEIPGYLGEISSIRKIISSYNIQTIFIADDSLVQEDIKMVVTVAFNYGIRTYIVPSFTEYLSLYSVKDAIKGIPMFELTLADTCQIMGVNISVTDMDKTLELIDKNLSEWKGKYICVSNVHTTVTASKDSDYRDIQNKAVIALPDGGPLSKFSRDKGFAYARRVTGPDLMKKVLSMSAEKGWTHYFYGSTEETLKKLSEVIKERYPGAKVVGMMSPPFRRLTIEEDKKIVEEINTLNPDFVWVGLGAPKQEIWMSAHEDVVKSLMIGVGAAFDYESGNIKRAPQWMQRNNLEWLYRLMQDPIRLFKRYLYTNVKYIIWTLRQ